MKKLLIILFGIFLCFNSNAQTDTLGYDLIFKRNVIVSKDTTYDVNYSTLSDIINVYVVPNNMVAKINTASMHETEISQNGCVSHRFDLMINDKAYEGGEWSDLNGSWLDSGDKLDILWFQQTSVGWTGYQCQYSYSSVISITEYTKVPIVSD